MRVTFCSKSRQFIFDLFVDTIRHVYGDGVVWNTHTHTHVEVLRPQSFRSQQFKGGKSSEVQGLTAKEIEKCDYFLDRPSLVLALLSVCVPSSHPNSKPHRSMTSISTPRRIEFWSKDGGLKIFTEDGLNIFTEGDVITPVVKKRYTLLRHFAKHMDEKLRPCGQRAVAVKSNESASDEAEFPSVSKIRYMRRWTNKAPVAITMQLSDGTFQVIRSMA